ncbi:MAG: hypothetical protein OXI77_16855 [Chloroflexota bacterium]|nr:hypothetical protein [Chloroflexota bacterium]MDE2908192.1 hypothetical protein [Chloroflexota bacterium]
MRFDLTTKFDFDAVKAEARAAAQATFGTLQPGYCNETFSTFNLVTGNVLQTVTVFDNTEEELTRKAAPNMAKTGM